MGLTEHGAKDGWYRRRTEAKSTFFEWGKCMITWHVSYIGTNCLHIQNL